MFIDESQGRSIFKAVMPHVFSHTATDGSYFQRYNTAAYLEGITSDTKRVTAKHSRSGHLHNVCHIYVDSTLRYHFVQYHNPLTSCNILHLFPSCCPYRTIYVSANF